MIETAGLWPLIEARASATPDARFAVDAVGREITFGAYRMDVLGAARDLVRQGIGPGDVVSWMLPTRIDALVLVGALARLGAIQNPILPIYRAREVSFIAEQCRPRLLITPARWRDFDYEDMARTVAAQVEGVETRVLEGWPPELPDGARPPLPAIEDGQDAAVRWFFYTSGTTSNPKGVQHSDTTLWAAAKGMTQALELAPSDRVAFVFPLTHIGGINWLQAALASGCSLILIENFADPSTMTTLREHGVTLGTAGTVFHEAYLKADRAFASGPLFPAMRAFPGGGAPKPPALHDALRSEMGGVGIVSGYGMTEAPILSMGRIDDPTQKLASTEGRPALPEVELRVVDHHEHRCGPGQEGEFRVRGPQLFHGYVDPDLDREAFDEGGYFRTGDLGYLDEAGYVVVTGRAKDVIIRKGENISAREVEDLLYAHPKVEDVAVIGLPDSSSGERCCAVVVGANPSEPLDLEEMAVFLRNEGLMVQKIPEQLEFVDSIPRNATGKIAKQALRDRFAPQSR